MQYTSLLEKNALISKTDLVGNIQFANEHFCETSGYSENELLGKNHNIISSGVHSKDFFKTLWDTISSGHIWVGEICNRAKNGRLYWVQTTIIPIFDELSGELLQYVSIRFDITEKKRFDEQLFQMQRLESIGRMAAGIAHDFNNILGGILGYAEIVDLLATDLPSSQLREDIRSNLSQVMKSSWRAADLIQKMLMYCKHSDSPLENYPVLDVSSVLHDILAMLRGMTLSSVVVNTHFENHVLIHIDETEFHQIIMNLCVNASDAMLRKGTIELTVKKIQSVAHQCSACAQQVNGEFAEISISDTGGGIAEEKIERIFDPFFTTKEVGKGTGLGLSVVSGIIHKIGGHVVVDSIKGVGTTFRLFFPLNNQ